ncbi:Uncharacterised protein [Pasteurella multocida]|nr:Uncharacterised protein [Pasteurella multocida]
MKLTKAQKEELLAVYFKSERRKTRLSQPVNRRLKRVLIKNVRRLFKNKKIIDEVFYSEMASA